jgi:hypothetical protein
VPVVAKTACLSFLGRFRQHIERFDKVIEGYSLQLRRSSYEVDRIVQDNRKVKLHRNPMQTLHCFCAKRLILA